ncbi:KR-domain-containing protein [Colletotrichum zoysiae]|uniref:KR-domain-containing protein n=1 Tax=Colletotrichum zoysiae TaxID=1216348 RepID=A0AAD9HPU2_9PEZI|nr:KR-domain-containing protein [Colletotrichum zoysiae]
MGIKRVTGGRGVDCALNSLAGELLRESFYCLAPLGIMVEIGSRDVIENTRLDMRPFSRSTTFSCFTLLDLVNEAPEVMAQATREAFDLVKRGIFKSPHPLKVLPISQVQEAFRLMQSGKHTGKLVLSFDQNAQVPIKRGSRGVNLDLRQDATYLLVGGLGGLGRSLAKLLISSGARNIAFLSRSGASSKESSAIIDELNDRGVNVHSYLADIADHLSLRSALACCSKDLPPIRGVFQMAMLLRDSPFETMTHTQWVESTRPKIQGTLNLHEYFDERHELDFFINFSSISGIIGNRAQANYAAGCAFQDAIAHQRRLDGLKGTSLDLGIMLDVGVIAENGSTGGLKKWENVIGVREPLFHALMKTVIERQQEDGGSLVPAQVCVGLGTADAFNSAHVRQPDYFFTDPRFGPLAVVRDSAANEAGGAGTEVTTAVASLKSRLSEATSKAEAAGIVTEGLVHMIAKMLQIDSLEVDTSRAIYMYGVDSLVAMELRNWVRREMDAQIQIFDILEAIPMTQLAQKIADRSKLIVEGSSESRLL